MWLVVASSFALSGIAAAQSGALAPAPGPAPGPFGVVRDSFRKYISVYGSLYIADETTYIYEYEYLLDYETQEFETRQDERPCGSTYFYISSYDDETVTISADRNEVLRPECTGEDTEPNDYGYFDYEYYCAQAKVPLSEAVSYSLESPDGTLMFSDVELGECECYGDYCDEPADNPLIGKTVSADATVECPVQDTYINTCFTFTSNAKRRTFSRNYYFESSCDGRNVPTFEFDGKDYKFDNLEFGYNVRRNYREVQKNKSPALEVPMHMEKRLSGSPSPQADTDTDVETTTETDSSDDGTATTTSSTSTRSSTTSS